MKRIKENPNEKLSLIIPVYNEEKTIETIIKKIVLQKYPIPKEIIIVDDCSQDNTLKKCNELVKQYSDITLIKHDKNLGKGAAVRTGLEQVTGTIIGIQDADLEYNPKDHLKLIKPFIENNNDIVYGSRFLGKNNNHKLTLFYLGNKFLSLITRWLYHQKITDMETCYKFFRKNTLNNITLTSKGFDIEPEITSKLLKKGYFIKEISILYKPRTISEGKKIKVKDGFIALWTLIKNRI